MTKCRSYVIAKLRFQIQGLCIKSLNNWRAHLISLNKNNSLEYLTSRCCMYVCVSLFNMMIDKGFRGQLLWKTKRIYDRVSALL